MSHQGIKAKHIAVGGIPASLVAGLVLVLTKHHVHLTNDEAVFYGGLALAAGTGLAHRIEKVGLRGFFDGVWNGNPDLQGSPSDSPPSG